ncbi:MAG: hypothetical protein A3C35_02150 [Omnitrophica bacterium RIFCSPHIGHO2_02_FULL_46_11]|nr:MAG: hypothetical protein A3C35_02150 [Omnitrophica bacterium RIFCSPHIGHO2_02_FULL_46_11]
MLSKEAKETTVLESFLKCCEEFSSRESFVITSPKPPEPDCHCAFSDDAGIYFELSEIIDEKIAQKFYDPRIPFTGGFFNDDILTDRIKEKLQKSYRTNGKRVDLILYFDLQPGWREDTMRQEVGTVMYQLGKGPFTKVWLFSVHQKKIIASFD